LFMEPGIVGDLELLRKIVEVSQALASQLRYIHDYSRTLPAKGSMHDMMGRWLEIHGGWYACNLRGSAVSAAAAEYLEEQVGLSRKLIKL